MDMSPVVNTLFAILNIAHLAVLRIRRHQTLPWHLLVGFPTRTVGCRHLAMVK